MSALLPVPPKQAVGSGIDLPAWATYRPRLTSEALVLLASLYFALFSNARFWSAAITSPSQQWPMAVCLFVLLVSLHALLLGLLINRWTAKPLLGVILLVTALASHFMMAFGLYLDADMIGNVLATDRRESSELLTWALLLPMLLGAIPILALSRVDLVRRSFKRALGARALLLGGALAASVVAAMAGYQPLAALMRNQHDLRYLATPGNWMVSLGKVAFARQPGAKKPQLPIGTDAIQMANRPAGAKPRLLVIVVGETARAQDWGLNGYARDTTPELRQAGVINFPNTSSCGTATEVSLPCMFSPWGGTTTTSRRSAPTNRCCTCWTTPESAWCGATTRQGARACAMACPPSQSPTRPTRRYAIASAAGTRSC